MAVHRKKSLLDIANQSADIMARLKRNGESENSPRAMRVVNATNRYFDNINNSGIIDRIAEKDRAKNNGQLSSKGIDQQLNRKIARSTYMGLNPG